LIAAAKCRPLDPADIILVIQSDRSFKLAGPKRLIWQKPTAALGERAAPVKEPFRRPRR
jgi:transcription-repair coupling factor (superfamily II helicase)